MKKKIIIPIVSIAILAIGVSLFAFGKEGNKTTKNTEPETTTEIIAEVETTTSTEPETTTEIIAETDYLSRGKASYARVKDKVGVQEEVYCGEFVSRLEADNTKTDAEVEESLVQYFINQNKPLEVEPETEAPTAQQTPSQNTAPTHPEGSYTEENLGETYAGSPDSRIKRTYENGFIEYLIYDATNKGYYETDSEWTPTDKGVEQLLQLIERASGSESETSSSSESNTSSSSSGNGSGFVLDGVDHVEKNTEPEGDISKLQGDIKTD